MAKVAYLNINSIVKNPLNVRDVTDGTALVNSLLTEGLKKDLIVASFDADHVPHWLETESIKFFDAINVTIDGNTRCDGLQKAYAADPDVFAKTFHKGVRCEVFTNPSPEEFWGKVQEMSEGQSLRTDAEFYRMFKAMKVQNPKLDHGKFVDTFGKILNVTSKRRLQLADLTRKAEAAPTAIEKAGFLAEHRKALLDAHKGCFQKWQAVSKNKYVEKAYLYTETGAPQEGLGLEYCCRITGWGTLENSTAAQLEKAWNDICESAKARGVEAAEEDILPLMARIRIQQKADDDKANEDKDRTPYAGIAKAVKAKTMKVMVGGVEKDLWVLCNEVYEASELEKAAAKAAAKANK